MPLEAINKELSRHESNSQQAIRKTRVAKLDHRIHAGELLLQKSFGLGHMSRIPVDFRSVFAHFSISHKSVSVLHSTIADQKTVTIPHGKQIGK